LAINRLKSDVIPIEHWSIEQADHFLAYTEQKYASRNTWAHLLYLLALNTGARWGEIIALDWADIDLIRRQICIRQIFDKTLGTIRASTKSGRFRIVGISEALFEPLAESKFGQISGLVFKNLASKPMDRWNFMRRHFYFDMSEAKVPRIRFHSLRHTYATAFMINGGNIYDLQKLLGHSSLKMTDHYSHFSPGHASQRANVVNLGRRLSVIEGGFGMAVDKS